MSSLRFGRILNDESNHDFIEEKINFIKQCQQRKESIKCEWINILNELKQRNFEKEEKYKHSCIKYEKLLSMIINIHFILHCFLFYF